MTSGEDRTAPTPHIRFRMLSAATRRAFAASATHKLAVERACPSPQPNTAAADRLSILLPRFNPATPSAISVKPHTNPRRYPGAISQPSEATPIIEPKNCAVKKRPARWSLKDQRLMSAGKSGPSSVVTMPVTTNPLWSRTDAAEGIGSQADRVRGELMLAAILPECYRGGNFTSTENPLPVSVAIASCPRSQAPLRRAVVRHQPAA